MDYSFALEREAGIIKNDGVYYNTPSDFARANLFYPYFGATYTCIPPYRVRRESNTHDVFLLIYVQKGEFHVETKFGHEIARTDEIVFINCRENHVYYVKDRCEFQWVHFDGSLSETYYNLLAKDSVIHRYHSEISKLLGTLLKMLASGIEDEHLFSLRIYEILVHMLQAPKESLPENVRKALKIMDEHFTEDLKIDAIAESLSLNPAYFSRLFHKHLGKTPHEHLTTLRLNQAKTMLMHTTMSVAQISDACGYASSTHFIRAFKTKNQITPQIFRKYYTMDGFQD